MSNVFWLTDDEINVAVKTIADYCNENPDVTLKNVIKELGVAQARAESSRILGIKFKRSIGKKNNHIPVKLKKDELETLQTSQLDSTIKDLFNDIH